MLAEDNYESVCFHIYIYILHNSVPQNELPPLRNLLFDYPEILVLVGAGIGVTPFASILRTIWHRLRVNAHSVKKIKKVSKLVSDI